MTDLKVRRLRFDFSDPVPVVWHQGNPAFSHAVNLMSFTAICFEKMIVEAVNEAKPRITDPKVAAEANAFLRQEAQHASAHRRHISALISRYPGLQQTLDVIMASYDEITKVRSLAYRLAYIANLEATFTPSFRFLLDNDDLMFRPGDDRVASLLLWHMVEEVEHRSSALIIFNAVVGKPFYRLRVVPSVIRHIIDTLVPAYIDGMNAHVPGSERIVDARLMSASWRIGQSLRKLAGRDHRDHPPVGGMLAGIDRKAKIQALRGLIRSQNPFFDPAHERLPMLADAWFERYERGDDVTHWYSTDRTQRN
jgi:predicted metal-dependent hydrolase